MRRGVQLPGYVQTDAFPLDLTIEYREGTTILSRRGLFVCTWEEAVDRGWFVLEYDAWDLGVRP